MVLKKTYLLRTIHIVGLVSYYISFPNFISVEYHGILSIHYVI